MRNRNHTGFTLVEILIVIAIISIFAAVLIPNLLNGRAQAFDTAAQTCLKELATREEAIATAEPFGYTGRLVLPLACTANGLYVSSLAPAIAAPATLTEFQYWAQHPQGRFYYTVTDGSGILRAGDAFSTPTAFDAGPGTAY